MENCCVKFAIALILPTLIAAVSENMDAAAHASLESRLYKDIFNGYNPIFRPMNQTNITIGLSLTSLVDVNEQDGHLTTTFLPKMIWTDPRLTWNRSYQLDHIQVPDRDIWVPDLEIVNRFKDVYHDNAMKPLVWLHNDGRIYYVPRRTYHTPCIFDMENFPFDVQHCSIILGSWAYLRNEVDFVLLLNGTDMDFFNYHPDFHVILHMERVEEYYGLSAVPFVELNATLTLRRRSTFFYYTYLMPMNILLCAIPMVHCLPSRSPTKFIVLGAVLLGVLMMLNTLTQFMPGYVFHTVPKILKLYLRGCLCLMASAIANCIVLSISNTNVRTKRMPLILRKILFGRFMLCCENAPTFVDYDFQLLHLERMLQGSTDDESQQQEMSLRNNDSDSEEAPSSGQQPIVKVLQHLVSELQLARYREQITIEWLKLARCVDHIFATAFAIAILCVISAVHRSG